MTLVQRAQELRKQGLTYAEIGQRLGIHNAIVWRFCNIERSRANVRESVARYIARGRIALIDMEHNK